MTSHKREGHNWPNIPLYNIWFFKKYIPSHKYLILQKGSNVVHDAALLPPLHPRGVLHLWKGLLPNSCQGFREYIMYSICEYMYSVLHLLWHLPGYRYGRYTWLGITTPVCSVLYLHTGLCSWSGVQGNCAWRSKDLPACSSLHHDMPGRTGLWCW